ncbi:MAG: hypothetical protein L3J24_14690 [Xanthomonadales bacterium]|nr:hypothetical protein [Xanthomonadales bacterium]
MKIFVGVLVFFALIIIPLDYYLNQKLIGGLPQITPGEIYLGQLATTTSYLRDARSGDITELKIKLTKKLDTQLKQIIKNNDDIFFEYDCFLYELSKFRSELNSDHLDKDVTKMLQEKLENNTCKYSS